MTVTTVRAAHYTLARLDDGKANALTSDVISSIRWALAEAVDRSDPIVIAGRDGRFCAGFDLKVMLSGDETAVSTLLAAAADLFREMCEAPVPVVAACTGHALAGGALLLLCADHRVGRSGGFRIGLNEVEIGMALPRFAVALARHRLESRLLTQAGLLATTWDGDGAVTAGYLDETSDDPTAAAVEAATRFARFDRRAFAVTKRRLREPLLAELSTLAI